MTRRQFFDWHNPIVWIVLADVALLFGCAVHSPALAGEFGKLACAVVSIAIAIGLAIDWIEDRSK